MDGAASTPTSATSRPQVRKNDDAPGYSFHAPGAAAVDRCPAPGARAERRRAQGAPREGRLRVGPPVGMGPGRAAEGPWTSTACTPRCSTARSACGCSAMTDGALAAGVLPGLQRLARRVLRLRPASVCTASGSSRCGTSTRASRELERCADARAQGRDDLGLPADRRARTTPDRTTALWAAAQDLELPLSLHIVTGMGDESRVDFTAAAVRYMHMIHEVQRSVSQLVLGGVLERFPRAADRRRRVRDRVAPPLDAAHGPRQREVRRHDGHQALDEAERLRAAPGLADVHGRRGRRGEPRGASAPTAFMWGSDFPHTDSTWPHSQTRDRQELLGRARLRSPTRSSTTTRPSCTTSTSDDEQPLLAPAARRRRSGPVGHHAVGRRRGHDGGGHVARAAHATTDFENPCAIAAVSVSSTNSRGRELGRDPCHAPRR